MATAVRTTSPDPVGPPGAELGSLESGSALHQQGFSPPGLEAVTSREGVAPLGLAAVTSRLTPHLEEARARGFLGPGPVDAHIRHAWPLVSALPAAGVGVDLGTGAGIPGLVLALGQPGMHWVLVDSQQRRAQWLGHVVESLDLDVEVSGRRAEEVGRGPLRGTASVVAARSFAAPGVTAECAAPLLRVGGMLWVAEPPEPSDDRWPAAGLATLGLVAAGAVPGWAGFEQHELCGERYPRRVGIPTKRPLF